MRLLRTVTGVTLLLTFGLIVLGAWVRATGSGLSCPDWPTCYGHWVPLPGEIPDGAGYTYFQVMLEWVHRLVAGVLVGPLVLVIAVLAWRARRDVPRLPLYGGVLLALLLVQASLGGVTVLDRNSPWSVALHLSTALVLFSVLFLIFDRSREQYALGLVQGRGLAVVVWVVALVTMASAAMTTKSNASFVCAGWPLCNETLIPDLGDPLIRLHVSHRLLAAAAAIGTIILWLQLRASSAGPLATLALVLIVVEVALGGLLVLLEIPIWSAVLHQGLGVLVFGALSLLMWRCVGGESSRREGRHVRLSSA